MCQGGAYRDQPAALPNGHGQHGEAKVVPINYKLGATQPSCDVRHSECWNRRWVLDENR